MTSLAHMLVVMLGAADENEAIIHLIALAAGGGVPGLGALGVVIWYVRTRLRQLDKLQAAERRERTYRALLRRTIEQVVTEQNRQTSNLHSLRNWVTQLGFGLKPSEPPNWQAGQIESNLRLPSDTLDTDGGEGD